MTYIFDFDGTLVDSMPVFSSKMEQIFRENNLPVAEDFVKMITPLGYAGTAQYAISLGYPGTVEDYIARATALMEEAYHYHIPAKAYVAKNLQRLKAAGHSLNVLTASPHAVLDKCLKRVGLYELFDNVWSCDDFATTKANPEIYKMAAARLGKQVTECTFLDDNLGAVTAAKKAGMISVGVYDDSSRDFVEEMKQAADGYVFDFREL